MLRPIQGAGLTGAKGRVGVSSLLARPAFNCWKFGFTLKQKYFEMILFFLDLLLTYSSA